MNLNLAGQLLAAADEQPHGFLRVDGGPMTHQVEWLASAGYVEASVQPGGERPTAVIKRVTDAGQELLRLLREKRIAGTSLAGAGRA